MIIAHFTIGYAVGKLYQKKYNIKLKENQQLFWDILNVVAAIGPDWDLILSHFLSRSTALHRFLPTHSPLFWIIIYLIITIVFKFYCKIQKEKILKDQYLKHYSRVFLLNNIVHIFLDIITGSSMLLWPFSLEPFTLLGRIVPYRNTKLGYFSHPAFMIELLLFSLSIILFLSEYTKIIKPANLRKTIKITTTSFTILIFFTTILLFKTYRTPGYMINFNPDIDFDSINNSNDNDANGNGILNIKDSEQLKYTDRIVQYIRKDKPLSIPKKYNGSRIISTFSSLTGIIYNNIDLIDKIYSSNGFSIGADIKNDIIINYEQYGIKERPKSYKDITNLINVNTLYIYFSKQLDFDQNLKIGSILFTGKDGKPDNVYIISDISKDGIKVLSTGNNWNIEEISIDTNQILPY